MHFTRLSGFVSGHNNNKLKEITYSRQAKLAKSQRFSAWDQAKTNADGAHTNHSIGGLIYSHH